MDACVYPECQCYVGGDFVVKSNHVNSVTTEEDEEAHATYTIATTKTRPM